MYAGEYRRWMRAKNRRRGLRIKTIEEDRDRKAAKSGLRLGTWEEVESAIRQGYPIEFRMDIHQNGQGA